VDVQSLAPKLQEPCDAVHHAETLQSLVDCLPQLFVASDSDSHHDVLEKVKVVAVDHNLPFSCLFYHYESDPHFATLVLPLLTRRRLYLEERLCTHEAYGLRWLLVVLLPEGLKSIVVQ
jgi:hypothetical protein